ncbi:MAG: hypothetical protein OXU81_04965, partial [Gammaproteobacteria bacterium]|nr:hypothetical protein [Gammaproteobacteria bacterium]
SRSSANSNVYLRVFAGHNTRLSSTPDSGTCFLCASGEPATTLKLWRWANPPRASKPSRARP